MIRRILVALDTSERAPHVLARAIDLARSTHAAIRIYQGVSLPPSIPPAAHARPDPVPQQVLADARKDLLELAARYSDVECDVVVDVSYRPPESILRAATAYDADLIVLGSHGYEVLDRLLGTTAAKVVNTSTRDVLVVHGHHAA